MNYKPFDLTGVKTYPLAERQSKVRHDSFAKPWDPATGFAGWMASWPKLLAASDFQAVVEAIRTARANDRPVVWGLGAHVIKAGLSPVIIDLMNRGFVGAIAMNGAGLIHDFEVALAGATSEEVDVEPRTRAIRHGGGNRPPPQRRDHSRRGAGAWTRTGCHRVPRREPSDTRAPQHPLPGEAPRHSDHGSRRDRHRHHSHASVGVRRSDRSRRVFEISASSRRSSPNCKAACT